MTTILRESTCDSTPARGRFPLCRLHGHSIIDELPKRCPLSKPSAIAAVSAMWKLAWSGIAQFDRDGDALDDGLAMQDRCEVCHNCIGRNLSHPTIHRLRRGLVVGR